MTATAGKKKAPEPLQRAEGDTFETIKGNEMLNNDSTAEAVPAWVTEQTMIDPARVDDPPYCTGLVKTVSDAADDPIATTKAVYFDGDIGVDVSINRPLLTLADAERLTRNLIETTAHLRRAERAQRYGATTA